MSSEASAGRAASLPDPVSAGLSQDMETTDAHALPAVRAGAAVAQPAAPAHSDARTPLDLPSAVEDAGSGPEPQVISGPLRPANEVLLEQLAPSSPVFRRRAFSSLLRVLLSGRGE